MSSHASPGYRFADVIGNRLYVAGQVPVDEVGQVVSVADAGAQCRRCLDNLQVLIEQHGFALADIHQLTIYVVGDLAALHAAWGEAVAFFESDVPPATLLDDPRFATASARATNADALYALLGELISTRSVVEWVAVCADIGVAAEPVVSLDTVIERALGNGSLSLAQHPVAGAYRQIAPSIRFDATPQNLHRHAPLIGEHTKEILQQLS